MHRREPPATNRTQICHESGNKKLPICAYDAKSFAPQRVCHTSRIYIGHGVISY